MNGRKTGRRLISFILSLVMIIGMVPMSAAAAPATDDNSTSANVSKVLSYAAQMRDENQKDDLSVGPFSWDTEKKKDTWRYFNGLMMDAFLMTGDESSAAFAKQFYDDNISDDGTIPDYGTGELDAVESARGLFDLLDGSIDNDKYELAIQFVYSELEKQTAYEQCGGNYLHKQEENGEPTSSWSDWNIGLDGLYMAEPFLMECANAIDEGKLALTGADEQPVTPASIYEAVYNRFKWVAENMKDDETGLYHHGWSVDRSVGNGHFWARGIGWYAMAQVDIIEMMPEGEYRSAMIAQLPAFFDEMLTWQDVDSGMWYNVVNRDASLTDYKGNKLETSGSAMMAYALMKAYNNGYVSDTKYGEAGLKAFNGIVGNKVSGEEGSYAVADIYQKSGVGDSDEYYCTNDYKADEAKGTGALIMAATLANVTAAALQDSPDPGDTPGSVTDPGTGISVSGTSATAIAVTDKSSDSIVTTALAEKLEDGFFAYDIRLEGYTNGTEATVTMPAPAGANKVYYVSDDGSMVEEITGAKFENETVTFTTDHFSIYASGVERTGGTGDGSGGTEGPDTSLPTWGLDEATEYPQYPDDGAVRINKTATTQYLNSTGVVNVELDTAGISVKQGVDVVLVVDVSNSMGWSTQNADGSNDASRLPGRNQQDKLTDAMNAASSFAEILLGDNVAGDAENNTLSFVTFAGLDTDNAQTPQTTTTRKEGHREPVKTTETYIDSVMTVFSGETSAEAAQRSFSNTKFYETDLAVNESNQETGSVYYYLNIAGTDGDTIVSGLNRGNTNYDYAFWQAEQAVNQLQNSYTQNNQASYADSGRETVVVFMTDGAASHYNRYRGNGNANDRIPGTSDIYPDTDEYPGYQANNVKDTWYNYMVKNDNTYATALYQLVNSFYAVGFDLAHGGFSNYQWTESELTDILEGLVDEQTLPVMAAHDSETLTAFYESLATQLRYAGTNAKVTDTIKSDFTLRTTPFGTDGNTISPTITVTAYDLYSSADGVSDDLIGTRKEGSADVLETVTFSEDGSQAYSDQINNGTTPILTESPDGSVVIEASTFTYTKDAEGVETFVWNIGNITDQEVALNYYAYLKGSMEGNCDAGVYDTNDNAILEYVDINGDYAKQEYPVPQVSWGSALTTIEYYLVNEDGQPVNTNDVVIPFANRITVGSSSTRTINWNETLTVNGRGYVPTGYEMFNPNARYTVTANSDGSGSLTIDDAKYITGTQNITTRRVDTDTDNYAATTVAFGVLHVGTPVEKTPLNPDQIVVDYGKAIQADVTTSEAEGSIYEVVGFMQYNASTDVKLTQFSDGTRTFNGDYGQFTIADGKVQYTLNRMLSAVEKIFVVVKVTPAEGETEAYRMLNELDVIPASNVYYETDFADGVFTFETTGAAWDKETVSGDIVADGSQDDGTIGQNLYGYDSSYANDKYQSNAGSWFVTGADAYDPTKTTSEFSFRGTGFDIISRTDTDEGFIRVTVYSDSAKTQVEKRVTVLNKSESQLRLYQIPVVSIEDLAYGTHYVDIEVYGARESTEYPALSSGGQFHFDAVRIYNPINASANASATSDAGIAYAAYVADGEADASVQEIREMLLTSIDDPDTPDGWIESTYDEETDEEIPGVVFVDRNQSSVGINDYKAIGPNNEVYLISGQAIAFKLTVDGELPTSIDIGAKSANGADTKLHVSVYNEDSEYAVAEISQDLSTSTAMFYNLLGDKTAEEVFGNGNTIYVYVDTNEAGGILSLTDLKVAYGNTTGSISITSDTDLVKRTAAPAQQEETQCDVLSAEFTANSVKRNQKATMQIVTEPDVESLEVLNQSNAAVKLTIDGTEVDADGNKVWTVRFTVTSTGNQSYTVTGYDAEGNSGASASDSIQVRVR